MVCISTFTKHAFLHIHNIACKQDGETLVHVFISVQLNQWQVVFLFKSSIAYTNLVLERNNNIIFYILIKK